MPDNIYLPELARITYIKEEVAGERSIKTFRVEPVNGDSFEHECGQCAMLSIFGRGEMMISIASSPLVKDYKQFSIMRVGRVSAAFHDLAVGDVVGIRGPYGNSFPVDDWRGKNLYFIGGGCGLAPIWPVITTAVAQRDSFKNITVFYGGRSPRDIMYKAELEKLRGVADVHLSVDKAEDGWDAYCGFVPANVMDKEPSSDNAIAITCGPPIMIKYVIQNLRSLGFADEQIYTTLENKMKCGLGKCGRCNVGKDYVCVKGPVYSWAELKELPEEY
ncbi:MAG: heterodisulfide reductase subunit F [Hydrogenophilales bacterium CG_4_9_14_3_um_filter_59_35]|nr:MAG: heterodisulfide reductase subunit F [Hydrogenophilales bacterium CG18_big_fil_WC_8_21_14_2_50_58_12]PIY01700.1 MAG: heterodisulfide reductase subunit F [Hydrogenophilales bacterium CG_4_10_14_3_um_filter_58_23]PJB04422.1 MAG: heterodisulfide reductase subunit F [Hydrogenophilales bacterium CG_4_9_14_3_um_filter_59_35]